MTTARLQTGGAGTQTAGLAFGGEANTGLTSATEEFSGPYSTLNYKTLTTS